MFAGLVKTFKSLFSEPPPGDILHRGRLPPSQAEWQALLERHTLAQLLPYESWDPDSGLYYNEDSVSFLLEVTPSVGMDDETLRVLSGLYSALPADSTAQYTLYASPDILPLIKRWANLRQEDASITDESFVRAHHRNENIFRATLRRRVEYLLSGTWSSLFSDQAMLIRDFKVLLSVTRPSGSHDLTHNIPYDIKEQMIQLRESISGTLRSAGLSSRPMEADAFINFMDTVLNPRHVRRNTLSYQEDRLIRDQVVDGDTLVLIGREGLAIQHGEMLLDTRMYSTREYPVTWAGWGMDKLIGDLMSNTLRIPCPFMMSFVVHVPDQVSAAGEAKYKSARATQMADSQIGKFVPVWRERKADWDFVSSQIQAGHSLVRGGFQVVLFAPHGSGSQAEHQLMALYKSAGWTLTRDSFVAVHAFLSALPMTAGPAFVKELESFSRLRTFLTWSCANLAPASAEWWGTGTPLLMLQGRRGQVMHIDPWDNKQGNYNMAMAAASGSGKSFFTQEIIMSILGTGGRVWTIDRGESYKNICQLLGGLYLRFDGNSNINLNPFTRIDNATFSDDLPMLKALVAHMASPSAHLGAMESSWIEQALKQVWATHRQQTTISHLFDALKSDEDPRKSDLADCLFPYTKEGVYARFFEGDNNLDLDRPFVALELKDLDAMPDLQSLVLLLLMMRITEDMYLGGRSQRKLCVIDEAWKLMGSGNAGAFIEEGYRTARKYEGAFLTVTQGINDYYKSGTAQAAFENSDWVFLLRQKKESLMQLQKSGRFAMEESEMKLLNSIHTIHGKYSEVATYSPEGMAIGRLIVDPFSEKLYSTKGTEFDFIQRAMADGKTLAQAVEQLAAGVRR